MNQNNMKKYLIPILASFLIAIAAQAFTPATLYVETWSGIKRVAVYTKEQADKYFAQGYKLDVRGQNLGTTITTINATDLIKDSRTTINTNFANLNSGKIEVSTTTLPLLTTLSNLSTVGTITSGIWQGTVIDVARQGTGTTSPTANYIILGNGASGFKVVNSLGTSGQLLTSAGVGNPPIWATPSVDLTVDYDWTGNHNFMASTSFNISSVFNGLLQASSTFQSTESLTIFDTSDASVLPKIKSDSIAANTTGTTTFLNNVDIAGSVSITGRQNTGFLGDYISSVQATTTAYLITELPAEAKFAVMYFECSGTGLTFVHGSHFVFSEGFTMVETTLNSDSGATTGYCYYTSWFKNTAGYFENQCTTSGAGTCSNTTNRVVYFYR